MKKNSNNQNSSNNENSIATFQSLANDITDSISKSIQTSDEMTLLVEKQVKESIKSSIKNMKKEKKKPNKIYLKTDDDTGFVEKDRSSISSNLNQTVQNISGFAIPKMLTESLQTHFQSLEGNLGKTIQTLQGLNQESFDVKNNDLNIVLEDKINAILSNLKNPYIQFNIQNLNMNANQKTQEVSLDVKANPATLKPFIKVMIESHGIKKQLSKIEFKIVSEVLISEIKISKKEKLEVDFGTLEGIVTISLKSIQIGPSKKKIEEKEITSQKFNRKLSQIEF